jgi:hypothetical protein
MSYGTALAGTVQVAAVINMASLKSTLLILCPFQVMRPLGVAHSNRNIVPAKTMFGIGERRSTRADSETH